MLLIAAFLLFTRTEIESTSRICFLDMFDDATRLASFALRSHIRDNTTFLHQQLHDNRCFLQLILAQRIHLNTTRTYGVVHYTMLCSDHCRIPVTESSALLLRFRS